MSKYPNPEKKEQDPDLGAKVVMGTMFIAAIFILGYGVAKESGMDMTSLNAFLATAGKVVGGILACLVIVGMAGGSGDDSPFP